jgi:iron complex outermembrane recepter protein
MRSAGAMWAMLHLFIANPSAAADVPSTRDLTELSLEQLSNLEVTSVSKKPERLADAPASVFVITAEDIRRSGATSLPEALRLAPNLQVAQVSASAYNIRARGINNNSANKLLVLIDGRSVYSPLFAGVFWDVQDVMLEDIERIEVISGPGGTLWGVNAVNGVINVITKSSKATQGGLLSTEGGNRGTEGALRYGGDLGSDGTFRVYGRYLDRNHSSTADGSSMPDGWYKGEAGFRADWSSAANQVMVQGNTYRGLVGQPPPGSISVTGANLLLAPIPVSGTNLTGRWAHTLPGGSDLLVQLYYDRTERTVPPTFAEKLDIVDLQVQHAWKLSSLYSIVYGAELRRSQDRVTNGTIFAFLPANIDQRWDSFFAQSEVNLREDLRLILGARLERNDYTGTDFLPNARISWKIAPDHLLWTAVSRTARAPSRLDHDAFVPATPPFLLDGGPDVRSEVAKVYEIGYREQASSKLSYSATVFHADYDRLHTQEIAPSRTFLVFSDLLQATTTGAELWGTWQASSAWRIAAGYTAQRETFRLKPGSNDASAVGMAAKDPSHTWLVRSSTSLGPSIDLDVTARGVAALDNPPVPAYSTADVRVGWRPARTVELSFAARNLADGGHGEFTSVTTRAEIGRSFYAGLRWDFDAR